MTIKTFGSAIGILAIYFLFLSFTSLGVLVSLNTLFELGLAYSLENLFAVLIIIIVCSSRFTPSSLKKS